MKLRRDQAFDLPRLRGWWANLPKFPSAIALICVLAAIGAGSFHHYRTNLSFRKDVKSLTGTQGVRGVLASLTTAPGRFARGVIASRDLDTLQIDIKFRDWQTLLRSRQRALEMGLLIAEEGDEVPAKVFFEGRKISIKMRLKGDWLDHLDNTTGWSFRVKVRNSDQIYGMRRFSIQHPRARGYYAEPLYLKHIRSEGILAPRYTFARVVVNGTDWGVMAIEEHFSKELLESQGRKEGLLGRFDEGLYWEQKATGSFYRHLDNFQTSVFKPFSRAKLELDPQAKNQAAIADGLMAAFQAGRIPGSEVFDIDRFARFVVISEAWRGWHALRWANQRFYFNPYTLKFEIVAYDNGDPVLAHDRSALSSPFMGDVTGNLLPRLLREEKMREALAREIARISGRVDEASLAALLEVEMREALAAIPVGNPLVAPPKLSIVADNLEAMRDHVDYFAVDEKINWNRRESIDASLYEPSLQYVTPRLYDSGELVVINRLPVPVTVEGMRFQPQAVNHVLPAAQVTPLSIQVPPTLDLDAPGQATLDVPRASFPDRGRLELVARIDGKDEVRSATIERSIPYFTHHPLSTVMSAAELAESVEWLRWNPTDARLEALPGDWEIHDSIVIPGDAPLDVPAGVTLRFAPDVSIRTTGALNLRGTKSHPIVLDSIDPERPGRGVFVNEASDRSLWEHVQVRNTNAYESDGLVLTGGITFRSSPVTMNDVVFDGTVAEDALNFVESDFSLDRVTIRKSRSDGFDCDFCTGRVVNSIFEDIGGDAFDVSGSQITLERSSFERVRDKAVSAGERSQVEARDLTIRASGSAIVSKDDSEVTANDVDIDGIGVAALMAYIKKPEFGPAQMRADNVSIQNADAQAIAQLGSKIILDGKVLETTDIDVKTMYESGAMKK